MLQVQRPSDPVTTALPGTAVDVRSLGRCTELHNYHTSVVTCRAQSNTTQSEAPRAAKPCAEARPSCAGRGGRGAEAAAAFPDIPTAVPRVRAAPTDDDFDVRSELAAEGGRGGRGKGKGRGLSEHAKEQRDLKRKVRCPVFLFAAVAAWMHLRHAM